MKTYFSSPRAAASGTHGYLKARSAPLRCAHSSSRQRVTDFWIPTVNVHKHEEAPDATQLLIRAGYLRQAYAGIFQMLPLGLRVQEKLERLIDKHMRSVKASKVSLSSLSSKALWQKSGRWKPGAEFFAFKDRKDSEWLLTPTHEEEITTLVAGLVQTRQQLPVRLYQIGRKYRDEKRPRGGLLRGREFLMKDLYTFDATPKEAHATYDDIRGAYRRFLDELTVPYTEARAVSGDMGGNLSHEYHFPNTAGEDIVITCTNCDYARNEEFSRQPTCSAEIIKDLPTANSTNTRPLLQEDYLSPDGQSLIRAVAPHPTTMFSAVAQHDQSLNSYAIKAALNGIVEIDSGLESPHALFEKNVSSLSSSGNGTQKLSIYYLLDTQVEPESAQALIASDMDRFSSEGVDFYLVKIPPNSTQGINLLKHQTGDPCPDCGTGTLQLNKAIEVGHTFHLGTRYSSKLGLTSRLDNAQDPVPVEMGCHGIGVSRLIAAVASCLSDESGLNWPRVIAPFEAVIIVQKSHGGRVQAAEQIYDELAMSSSSPSPSPNATVAVDVLLDDRQDQGLGWKLKDADAIGYPVIIVVGRSFDTGKVEVQCRRLKIKRDVEVAAVAGFVRDLLQKL
ncbi:proline-tRNA ligase [Exophiala oligosperma]|uniref:proline--tRNA ligase n=1 Tax=Exophiala oligosperma TaxID=215243 RepID=A0A0D2DXL8_9EURO|nr:proline-tRNA ligase [Exophiala oligosperma]KIW40274.1 proline-tRNA ligase [Exophiala oligosperma]